MDEKVYVFIAREVLSPFHNVEGDLRDIERAIDNKPLEFIKGYLSNSRDGAVDIVKQDGLSAYINGNTLPKYFLEISVDTNTPVDSREIKAIRVNTSKLPESDLEDIPDFSNLHGKSATFIEGYLSSLIMPNARVALTMSELLHALNNPVDNRDSPYQYYEV